MKLNQSAILVDISDIRNGMNTFIEYNLYRDMRN